MTDTPRDAPLRTAGIPVHDAAHLLGISENAVRARLRRGTLVGVKRDTSWDVVLRATDIPTMAPAAKVDVPEDAPRHIPVHTAVHDEIIEELRADKRYLQDQLDRALRQLEAERERADTLQALSTRSLVTGTTEPASTEDAPKTPTIARGSTESDDRGPTGVLAWWKRLWSG